MDVDIQSLPVYVHHRFPRCPEKQIGLPQKQIFVAPKTNNIAIEFEQHWHFWSNIQHSSCFSSKLILQVIQSSECLFGWVQLIFWPFLSLMFDHDRHHDLKPSLVFRLLVPVFTSASPPLFLLCNKIVSTITAAYKTRTTISTQLSRSKHHLISSILL